MYDLHIDIGELIAVSNIKTTMNADPMHMNALVVIPISYLLSKVITGYLAYAGILAYVFTYICFDRLRS